MRLLTTIFLTLLTAALCGWFYMDMQEKLNATTLDESGALPAGSPLFDNPALLNRHSITLSNKSGNEHIFQLNLNSLWECTSPYQDRASGIFHLQPLLDFTMGAEVVESIPVSQIKLKDYGMTDNWTKVTVKDIHNKIVANYKIGIDSAWKHRVISQDERGQQVATDFPTVYVIKENAEDDHILYLVADPTFKIRSLFENNFENFRDHNPFALNRRFLEQISIKQAGREIVLDHSSPESPWRISKPLDLTVDNKALSNLLVDISNLRAIKLHKKDSITLPQESTNLTEITIKNFESEELLTLTVYPPTDATAKTAYATMNNRDVIFELPIQPIEGYKSSIASLPSSVNSLRARNMLNLTRANIRGFIIRKPTTEPIIISRPSKDSNYELLAYDGKRMAPNEVSIANLIAVISQEPIKEFVSDAATDLTIYGFQNPILTIDVIPLAGKPQKLFFSLKKQRIYANLQGSGVVWELDTDSYMRIATKEWEWKSNIVWDLMKSDIVQFTVEHSDIEKVTVQHDYLAATIIAKIGENDVTQKINPLQVSYFINTCSQLNARRRLGPNDEQARKALENPVFTASITTQIQDLETTELSETTYNIEIAKPSETAARAAYYYAKCNNDPDYFMITPAVYQQFTTDLFSEE